MELDLIPILSTVILATTIVTIVLAVGSYFAYKLRDRQRAREKSSGRQAREPAKVFRRYRPGATHER